jgi:hypothetical protein
MRLISPFLFSLVSLGSSWLICTNGNFMKSSA